jgi:hypothetical protein
VASASPPPHRLPSRCILLEKAIADQREFDCKSLARVSYIMFRPTGNIALSDVPIEYETVQFFTGVGNDISEYQGPSTPQTDAAWSNLLDGKSFNVSLTEMCTR